MKVHDLMMSRLIALGNIPNINSGGCAIVAHRLHSFLTDKGYKPQIIYLLDEEDTEIERNNNPVACAHALVKIANRYYHAGGEFNDSYFNAYNRVKVSPEYVQLTIKDPSCSWHWGFNRQHIGNIHTILS